MNLRMLHKHHIRKVNSKVYATIHKAVIGLFYEEFVPIF